MPRPMPLHSLAMAVLLSAGAFAESHPGADANTLPTAPAGFEVKWFAKEPLVRQPYSMAFDAKGRLFVNMGPQDRYPKPETPGDSVVIVVDADGDGEDDDNGSEAGNAAARAVTSGR